MTAEPTTPAPACRQLLTFRVAGEWFALEVGRVRRVEPRPELTPVPGAPQALPGVFLSHGQLVPALDPRVCLRLPAPAEAAPAFAVIAAEGDLSAGLLVDWVDDVVRVDETAIEPPAPGNDCATGQVRLGNRLLSLLNLPALFAAATGE
ncbi:MAG: chemotaxis protein CheW [Armatimonadetes bacterium]|jgi:purine-binding chemotaxis protein CheW|nr:chemotaxis protein CheW [Armatimonadota bacterium]